MLNPYMIICSPERRFVEHKAGVFQNIVAPILHNKEALDQFIQQRDAELWKIAQKIDRWKSGYLSDCLVGEKKVFNKKVGIAYDKHYEKRRDVSLAELRSGLPRELISDEQINTLIQCMAEYTQTKKEGRVQHGKWFAAAISSLAENPFSLKVTPQEAQADFKSLLASTSPNNMQQKEIVVKLVEPIRLKGYIHTPERSIDTKFKLKEYNNNRLGRRAVGLFSGAVCAKSYVNGFPSLDDLYKNKTDSVEKDFFYKFILQVHYTGRGAVHTVTQAYLRKLVINSFQSPSQFYIESGYALLWHLLSSDMQKDSLLTQLNYFDPFAGWGDRLLIALLFANHHPQTKLNYLGNDCNRELLEPYQQIVTTYGANLPNFQAHFSMQTVEDFIKATEEYALHSKITTATLIPLWQTRDILQLHFDKGIDFSMTSPPYAGTEIYSKDMPDYGKKGTFKIMMEQLCRFYARYLRQNGYFVLNMSFNSQIMKQLGISMNQVEEIMLGSYGSRKLELVERYAGPAVSLAFFESRANTKNKSEKEAFLVFRMTEQVQHSLVSITDANQRIEEDKKQLVYKDEANEIETILEKTSKTPADEGADFDVSMQFKEERVLMTKSTYLTRRLSEEETSNERPLVRRKVSSSSFFQPVPANKMSLDYLLSPLPAELRIPSMKQS